MSDKIILELLDAIDAWCAVDSDVADQGMTKELGYRWDDAKDLMVASAKKVREDLGKKSSFVAWCYSCDDSENRVGDPVSSQYFHSLAAAKRALEKSFLADCKKFGKDDLEDDVTQLMPDGMHAVIGTISEHRHINYRITKIEFDD